MRNVRVIPRLDIKAPNLVKGIHLEGLRVLGKPEEFARKYYEEGADELLYMEIVASLYERNSILELIHRTSLETFIPLSVGGGLRTVEDVRKALECGADKVVINTAAVNRPEFVREASRKFGSSTIVISIEAKRQADGSYEAYTDNGRERTGRNAYEWAQQAVELGAGELIVTSIDREGTGTGYDLELTRAISNSVSVPVIACGGAGSLGDVKEAVNDGCADAVSLASVLHYEVLSREPDESKEDAMGQPLSRTRSFSKIQPSSLVEVKEYLDSNGMEGRRVI